MQREGKQKINFRQCVSFHPVDAVVSLCHASSGDLGIVWGHGAFKSRSAQSWEVELSVAERSWELTEPHQSCVHLLGTGGGCLHSRIKEPSVPELKEAPGSCGAQQCGSQKCCKISDVLNEARVFGIHYNLLIKQMHCKRPILHRRGMIPSKKPLNLK